MRKFWLGIVVGVAISFAVVDVSMAIALNDQRECMEEGDLERLEGCYLYRQSQLTPRILNMLNPVSGFVEMYVSVTFDNVKLISMMMFQQMQRPKAGQGIEI